LADSIRLYRVDYCSVLLLAAHAPTQISNMDETSLGFCGWKRSGRYDYAGVYRLDNGGVFLK
jgi:hypothetical protein